MTGMARDEFLRRYATSPIHIPRLERLLAVYGDDGEAEAFCNRFIGWDRASPDCEAARIVAEILSAGDSSGRITRISDEAVKGAIRWMSDVTSLPVSERARCLSEGLNCLDGEVMAGFIEFLAAPLEAAEFNTGAEKFAVRLAG